MALEDGGGRCKERSPKARYFNSHTMGRYREGRELRQGMLVPVAALAASQ